MANDSLEVNVAKNTTKIVSLEDNVSKLWDKWDSMQKMVIGTLISTILSLVGVVVILIKLAV